MIYLVGLGLYFQLPQSVIKELEGFDIVVIDGYTVTLPPLDFPYPVVDRKFLEEDIWKLMDKDIAILVAGDPLFATTHTSIYFEALKRGIEAKVFHNSSILNAVSRTGLSAYKFGRVVSVVKWSENYKPTSYLDHIKQNQSLGLHTLVLPDPQFKDFNEFLFQMPEDMEMITLHRIGWKEEGIYFDKRNVKHPFAVVVPGEVSHYEREHMDILRQLSQRSR
ncbi:MAG: diphthine synthase [Candidatus Micrarchaeota archaeon]|nr:diphthine synthase [Candidatus Micrarchaeota archaeon]